MKISLSDAGKRFNRDWIFRHLTFSFESSTSYAITGPNGSGKSTLLQLLAGAMDPSEGKIEWQLNGTNLENEYAYKNISICAPYLELIEEMTGKEFLQFHHQFKPFMQSLTSEEIISSVGLNSASHKQIRYYSSGMKQRVKLAQAIFSDTPIVLLDEPCTNLDETGYELYYSLVNQYCQNRILIVSSNEKAEYSFCKEVINIQAYK